MTAYRAIVPAPDLKPFVQYYWVLSGGGSDVAAHPIFPDGAPELVFNFGDLVQQLDEHGRMSATQPRAMLVGQMTRALWVVPSGRMQMVGVKLTPWGASAFIGGNASDWRDRTVALADIWAGAEAPAMALECAEARGDAWLPEALERMLRDQLDNANGRRLHRLTAVARALHQSSGGTIEAWARRLGWSARTLERHFDAYVGLSPKELQRLKRFQRALNLGTHQPRLTWSVVAARAGYADRSHLIREFREFAGAPPGATLSRVTSISSHFLSEMEDA